MDNKITISCLEVAQPIGTFYIGVINASDLLAISYAEVRRQDGREIEKYIGTQRDLSPGRVSEIKKYVTTVDACFPTSIILSIDDKYVEYDHSKKVLIIDRNESVAKIIDGQHRIAGLEGVNKAFQLNVTIFLDMDLEDQAMVFSTINLKQTKVTKSLAYDLFEYAESRSPQKTAHNIAKLMNFKSESPFYDRLKILGKASDSERQVITQATFVDRLLRMISNDPMRDRDIIKRGGRLELVAGKEKEKFVFRNRFIREKDAETAKILWNYFAAVSKRWNSAWNDFDRGRILCRTTGFAALMRLLPDIFVKLSTDVDKNLPSVDDFYDLFEKSSLKDQEFTSDQFKPGSSGEGELYRRLSEEILK